MRIESGKFYRCGLGDSHGPMRKVASNWLDQHGAIYKEDGTQWNHVPDSAGNLVVEITTPPTPQDTQADDRELAEAIRAYLMDKHSFYLHIETAQEIANVARLHFAQPTASPKFPAPKTFQTFDAWWDTNVTEYLTDALHMSEYHMASVVWNAAQQAPLESAEYAWRNVKVCDEARMEEMRKRDVAEAALKGARGALRMCRPFVEATGSYGLVKQIDSALKDKP